MSAKVVSKDRRKTKRFPIKVQVKIGAEFPEYSAYLMNISPNGTLIHSAQTYPVGTKLMIRVIDESVMELNTDIFGEVVWSNDEKDNSFMGIIFNSASKKLINEHI